MRKRRKTTAEEYNLDLGTVQTRKRLRQSSLSKSIQAGWCSSDMERAAREIEDIWHADMGRSMIKISSMERVDCSTGDDMPDRLKEPYSGRYLPWCRFLGKHFETPIFGIVIDWTVWDCGLEELDRKHKKRNGFSKQRVKAGLKLYANLAGWTGEQIMNFKEQNENIA